MDIVNFPDPSEGGMGFAYLTMTLVFIAASFSVYRLKKAAEKKEKNPPKEYPLAQPTDKNDKPK